MAVLTGAGITMAQIGSLSARTQTDASLVKNQVAMKRYSYTVPASLTGTNATEIPFAEIPVGQTGGIVVTKVQVVSPADLTADTTSYATIQLEKTAGAGVATRTVMATANTTSAGTGSWTAFSGVNIPVTSASSTVPAGGLLVFKIAKVAGGVTVTAGTTILVDGYPL